jgi:shikimate dehydrogenase
MKVGNRTKLFAIIGMPAHHSLSPAIHNAAFEKEGINAVFLAFDVPKDKLMEAIEGMKAFGISGLTLTSPHKEEAHRYVDSVDKFAEEIEAVNTIVNKNGKLMGYNSDSPGFLKTVRKVNAKTGPYAVVGAGGAARAFVFAILNYNPRARIHIINRTMNNAKKLQNNASRYYPNAVMDSCMLGSREMERSVKESRFVINATNITLENSTRTPIPRSMLNRKMTVFDANYVPFESRLLKEARLAGCDTINGLELLVNQGVVAFKLFTGKSTDYNIMKKAALNELEKIKERR